MVDEKHITQEELTVILKEHKKWLNSGTKRNRPMNLVGGESGRGGTERGGSERGGSVQRESARGGFGPCPTEICLRKWSDS
jgi:hypothetical protein